METIYILDSYIYIPGANNLVFFLDSTEYNNLAGNILTSNFYTINIDFINSYPLFIYFGFLFIFSTVVSLFCLSYLGLYGVFVINLITIVLF